MDRDEQMELIVRNMDKLADLVSDTTRLLHQVVEDKLWDDVDAAWAALEASTAPGDVELMKRIRAAAEARAAARTHPTD